MIDFNYTAPELLPFRIQEVLDAPNEPHRIGGVVYVPEGGGECEIYYRGRLWWCCDECGEEFRITSDAPNCCPNCGRKAAKR